MGGSKIKFKCLREDTLNAGQVIVEWRAGSRQ